jgi:hypothetical protein
VSTYRDSLPEGQRPVFDQAVAAFMDRYTDSWADLWEFAEACGLRAAAERCASPGRDVDAIEAKLREIYDQARGKRESGAD